MDGLSEVTAAQLWEITGYSALYNAVNYFNIEITGYYLLLEYYLEIKHSKNYLSRLCFILNESCSMNHKI